MQREEHGNPQPLGQALHGDGDRIAPVGPDHVRPVPAQKDVAAREERLGSGGARSTRRDVETFSKSVTGSLPSVVKSKRPS